MQPESLRGKPERVQPIPTPNIQRPASDADLSSQANKAVDQLTRAATGARHQLGHSIPKNSDLLG